MNFQSIEAATEYKLYVGSVYVSEYVRLAAKSKNNPFYYPALGLVEDHISYSEIRHYVLESFGSPEETEAALEKIDPNIRTWSMMLWAELTDIDVKDAVIVSKIEGDTASVTIERKRANHNQIVFDVDIVERET